MDEPKPHTAAPAVIRSIIWAIGATFAILGAINMFVYVGNSIPYFIIASIFGVMWGILEAKHLREKSKMPDRHSL